MQEIKVLKIGQKFIFPENVSVKQSSGNMITIPAGTEGYVSGNGYIIVTDGEHRGQWVYIDKRKYRVDNIDYDGVAEIVVTGLTKEGYALDGRAFMLVVDYLRSIAIR